MDNIDSTLKTWLENETAKRPPSDDALSTEELYSFIADELDEACYREVFAKIRGSAENQALVAKAREMLASADTGEAVVPLAPLAKAKALVGAKTALCPHCRKPITPFKTPLKTQRLLNFVWLAAAMLCFGLSFAFKRYFFQCLVAAALLGVKWIVDARAIKTQILIYKALSDDTPERHSRDLHRHSGRL